MAPRTGSQGRPGRHERERGRVQSEPDDVSDSAPDAQHQLDLSGLNNVVGYILRRAQIEVFADFIHRFEDLDLKPAQYSVLLVIGNNPGRKQSAIAATLGIQRTNFVAMLDELERRGLAERVRSTTDRRSHAIELTAKGRALLAKARTIQIEQEDDISAVLGPDGHDRLIDLAGRLLDRKWSRKYRASIEADADSPAD